MWSDEYLSQPDIASVKRILRGRGERWEMRTIDRGRDPIGERVLLTDVPPDPLLGDLISKKSPLGLFATKSELLAQVTAWALVAPWSGST